MLSPNLRATFLSLCFCSHPPTQWTYHLGIHLSDLPKKSFCSLKQSHSALWRRGAYRNHITPFYSALKILKLHDLDVAKKDVAKLVLLRRDDA